MVTQQKRDHEETCDHSDAFAVINLEGLEWERNLVMAQSFYGVYCKTLFLSWSPYYKIGKVSEHVFKCYYLVAMEQNIFSVGDHAEWVCVIL